MFAVSGGRRHIRMCRSVYGNLGVNGGGGDGGSGGEGRGGGMGGDDGGENSEGYREDDDGSFPVPSLNSSSFL